MSGQGLFVRFGHGLLQQMLSPRLGIGIHTAVIHKIGRCSDIECRFRGFFHSEPMLAGLNQAAVGTDTHHTYGMQGCFHPFLFLAFTTHHQAAVGHADLMRKRSVISQTEIQLPFPVCLQADNHQAVRK